MRSSSSMAPGRVAASERAKRANRAEEPSSRTARVARAVGCWSSRQVTATVGPSPVTVGTTGRPAGCSTVLSPRTRRRRVPSHTRRPPATWNMAGYRGAAVNRAASGVGCGARTMPTGRRRGGAATSWSGRGAWSARASTTGTARVCGAAGRVAGSGSPGRAAWSSVVLRRMVLPRRRRSPDPCRDGPAGGKAGRGADGVPAQVGQGCAPRPGAPVAGARGQGVTGRRAGP